MSFLGNTPTTQSFTSLTERFNGNGSATTVTLSRAVYNASDIEVLVNNVQQDPYDAYTVNGTQTLTFTEAPSSGTGNIIVTYRSYIISKFIPAEGTVTAAAIADGTITGAKITSNTINGSQIVDRSITGLEIAANTIGSSNLITTGVSSGTYGGATQIPVVTVGTDGRLSYAANVAFIGSQWTTTGSDIYYTAGNIGIGTTSPSNRVSIVTASGSDGILSVKSPSTDTAGILIDGGSSSNKGAVLTFAKDATTKWRIGIDSAIAGGTSNNLNILGSSTDALLLGTNSTARFAIGSSGQFGIGTSPSYGTSGQVLTSGGASAAPTWATAASGLTLITTLTATNSTSLTFTNTSITSTYDAYLFVFNSLTAVVGNSNLFLKTSTDNGSTFATSDYEYHWAAIETTSNSWQNQASQIDTALKLGYVLALSAIGANPGRTLNGQVYMLNPLSSATRTQFVGQMSAFMTSRYATSFGGGVRQALEVNNAIQFFFDSGNISSGTIQIFGVQK